MRIPNEERWAQHHLWTHWTLRKVEHGIGRFREPLSHNESIRIHISSEKPKRTMFDFRNAGDLSVAEFNATITVFSLAIETAYRMITKKILTMAMTLQGSISRARTTQSMRSPFSNIPSLLSETSQPGVQPTKPCVWATHSETKDWPVRFAGSVVLCDLMY